MLHSSHIISARLTCKARCSTSLLVSFKPTECELVKYSQPLQPCKSAASVWCGQSVYCSKVQARETILHAQHSVTLGLHVGHSQEACRSAAGKTAPRRKHACHPCSCSQLRSCSSEKVCSPGSFGTGDEHLQERRWQAGQHPVALLQCPLKSPYSHLRYGIEDVILVAAHVQSSR